MHQERCLLALKGLEISSNCQNQNPLDSSDAKSVPLPHTGCNSWLPALGLPTSGPGSLRGCFSPLQSETYARPLRLVHGENSIFCSWYPYFKCRVGTPGQLGPTDTGSILGDSLSTTPAQAAWTNL